MPLTITRDLSDDVADRLPAALDAGLTAAGYIYRNEVMRALAGGYTSGDFVTGRVMNSVTMSAPSETTEGARGISVGTDVMYAMFWELGHHNIFTRQYERVEIWAPALDVMGPEMEDAFTATVLDWLTQGIPE